MPCPPTDTGETGPVGARQKAKAWGGQPWLAWSHNEHFHPWILRRLPVNRRSAVDVGCGQGELLSRLAPFFDAVEGTDVDAGMRVESEFRCADLPHVTVSARQLEELEPGIDLITMVSVLHHLDAQAALVYVRDLLAPGGRFLAVGLAKPAGLADFAWEIMSVIANPIIGILKRFRRRNLPTVVDRFPTRTPALTLAELKKIVRRVMPGAKVRRRLAFRHTIEYTKPLTGPQGSTSARYRTGLSTMGGRSSRSGSM